MNDEEFKRLYAKLQNFPPYDWEEDVEMLLTELDRYMKETAHCQELLRMQPVVSFSGPKPSTKYQLDIALDALMRIATRAAELEDQTIVQIARAAQVRIQGER